MPDLNHALTALDGALAPFQCLPSAVEAVKTNALKDHLTPLQNARALAQAFETAIAVEEQHLVVFGDLTGFKSINDSRGHAAGDAVLQHVGEWLHSLETRLKVRAFRKSGDEFVLLVPHSLLSSLCAELDQGIPDAQIDGTPIQVRASFGHCPLEGNPALAIKHAERACICAKQANDRVRAWNERDEPAHQEYRWRCAHCSASIKVDCPPSSKLSCPACGAPHVVEAAPTQGG